MPAELEVFLGSFFSHHSHLIHQKLLFRIYPLVTISSQKRSGSCPVITVAAELGCLLPFLPPSLPTFYSKHRDHSDPVKQESNLVITLLRTLPGPQSHASEDYTVWVPLSFSLMSSPVAFPSLTLLQPFRVLIPQKSTWLSSSFKSDRSSLPCSVK